MRKLARRIDALLLTLALVGLLTWLGTIGLLWWGHWTWLVTGGGICLALVCTFIALILRLEVA